MQSNSDSRHPRDICFYLIGEIITIGCEIIDRLTFCGKMQNLFDTIYPVLYIYVVYRQIIDHLIQNLFIKIHSQVIYQLCYIILRLRKTL